MGSLDPTKIRLSKDVLLCDVMGTHSVYNKPGHRNRMIRLQKNHPLMEGRHLFDVLVQPLLDRFGPASFSYGFISPELSCQIVRWRNPTEPSYHRWDDGAAVDLVFHRKVKQDVAPLIIAACIDLDGYPYSRMITYSESPFICLATKRAEKDSPRRAFYENRYENVPGISPAHIKYSSNYGRRREQVAKILKEAVEPNNGLPVHWRGQGWPSYHGGGIRQVHHFRTGDYSVLGDFLYNRDAVHNGTSNGLPARHRDRTRLHAVAKRAGVVVDTITSTLGRRVSIIDGYHSKEVGGDHNWLTDGFRFEIVPPSDVLYEDVADIVRDAHPDARVEVVDKDARVRVIIWEK